jgi:hypothetical protein
MSEGVTREDILSHVARYWLTTADILQSHFYPSADTDAALKGHLKRLLKSGDLVSEPLYPTKGPEAKLRYYHLGPPAASVRGLPNRYGEEVKDIYQRATALGVASYCVRRETPRPRLTLADFRFLFPDLLSNDGRSEKHFHRGDYVIGEDEQGTRRLTRLAVDVNRRPDDLPAACLRIIERDAEVFELFQREQRYALTLLVPTASKAAALARLIERPESPLVDSLVPVSFAAVPALLPFIEATSYAA